MSARNDILNAIRSQRVRSTPRPAQYRPPETPDDLVATFIARAAIANAQIHSLDSHDEIPVTIADILRAKNLSATIHVPPGSVFAGLPWDKAPGMTLKQSPPGPDNAALAIAPFGIAETGTLVYPAGNATPASWHFRAGFEIAVLNAADILAHMENALAQMKGSGALPHTINFVTGPSRTGDIEQTLELGAHGPKALAILIIRNAAKDADR